MENSCKNCLFWMKDKVSSSPQSFGKCNNEHFSEKVKVLPVAQIINYVKDPRFAPIIANSTKTREDFSCSEYAALKTP